MDAAPAHPEVAPAPPAAEAAGSPPPPSPAACRPFRPAPLLSERELRRLRQRQEEFARAAADQLALLLRQDFRLEPKDAQPLSFERWAAQAGAPTALTLFRLEPLPGACLANVPLPLGWALVDRLMGGPGRVMDANREFGEIEAALLDQVLQVLLAQWCRCWNDLAELRPALTGRESDARFLSGFAPGATLLTLAFAARCGENEGTITLAFPFATLEPLLRRLVGPLPHTQRAAASAPADSPTRPLAESTWNPVFDTVPLTLTISLDQVELSARQIADLKPGDWVGLPPTLAGQARVRAGGKLLFLGRLGTRNQRWAVELTQAAKD